MRKNRKLGSRIVACSLSVLLALGCFMPASASGMVSDDFDAENLNREVQERTAGTETVILPEADLTMGAHAVLVDNDKGGKALHINTSWVSASSSDPLAQSASFKDPGCFQKTEFTLSMNVYRLENGGNANHAGKVAFSVGNDSNYFNLRLVDKGSLTGSGISDSVEFTENPTKDRMFSSVVLSYKEDTVSGKVTVYIDGKKVLNQADVGFKLSGITDLKANIGSGRGTGFMVEGVYDDIRVSDTAVTGESLETVSRYQPYHTFSGVRSSYGGTLGSSVKVAEWLDTNGEHIQAHGGQVQWLETLDLDEDGVSEGGWIWYGEDKTRNGKPIDGIHCYTSPDLYNWTDRGMALYTHDMLPDKLNAAGDGVEPDTEGLAKLKNWAQMTAPSADVTMEQITMAKDFLAAYKTNTGYDEGNLAKAYKYLYSGYCIAERPKMLYNATTKKYVLFYHADGPSDANIVKYLKDNNSFPSRYTRASMGFAVSDTPYGPFKLVNVQRMNYKTGGNYDTNQGMARDMTVFLDDTDINKDGVKDAYAVYSSESNKYMYISLLDGDYTAPLTQGTTDTITLEDGTTVKTFADRVLGNFTDKEAPAVFKYQGVYYMITSGTSGWEANAASYFRADNIYGPWTAMGDPCEGTSNSTFTSQPTAVIPVDAARGKFIYMGDRWSYTKDSNGSTDSAHWDSGYVWLPIDMNDVDGITVRNISDWDLSVLDKPTSKNIVYFVDAGTEGESGGTFYKRLKESTSLKNSENPDQPYSSDGKWGYVGSNTEQRTLSSTDLYEKLRYVSDSTNRTLTYQFDDLQAGEYTVCLGFYDPSSWYKDGKRVATVTLKQNDNVLKSSEVTCGGNGRGTIAEYKDLTLEGEGSLQISLAPKNTGEGSDVQISWIAIVDNKETEPIDPPDPPGPPDPPEPPEKIDISKEAKLTLSQSVYTYSGGQKKPVATVKAGTEKLERDRDYTVSYINNVNVGTASVVVTGMGDYTGKLTKSFTINPKGTALSGKITAQSKGFTVKWKKQSKNTTGYQIQYSTSRKFTKKTTVTKIVKKKTTAKLSVKKLKAKKKYYVRVRIYHTVKGKEYYSDWSKDKSVSTK